MILPNQLIPSLPQPYKGCLSGCCRHQTCRKTRFPQFERICWSPSLCRSPPRQTRQTLQLWLRSSGLSNESYRQVEAWEPWSWDCRVGSKIYVLVDITVFLSNHQGTLCRQWYKQEWSQCHNVHQWSHCTLRHLWPITKAKQTWPFPTDQCFLKTIMHSAKECKVHYGS